MRPLALLTLALLGLLGACAEAPASLQANAGPVMPVGVPDRAPSSFTATCTHSPSLCGAPDTAQVATADDSVNAAARLATLAMATTYRVRGSDGLHIAVLIDMKAPAAAGAASGAFDDGAALRLLQTVNNAVNGVMARDTSLLINTADDWAPAARTANGLVGDCKSFAAEKRRRLIAAGFPADRLFYAVVFREDIGLHALLMAHLDGGDYALDSRQPWVTPWYEAAYTYVQRQALGDPMHWTNLVAAPTAVVAPILLAQNRIPAAAGGAGSR